MDKKTVEHDRVAQSRWQCDGSLFVVLTAVLYLIAIGASPAQTANPSASSADKPFGIERLIPLTTSRVVGSPDPPLPYRVQRAFARLKVSLPLSVTLQPDSDLLVCITQDAANGPTKIIRFKDDEQVDTFETLLRTDGAVYDLAFHPDFKDNGYLYLGTNDPTPGEPVARATRVVRYTMHRDPPNAIDPQSATRIIDWPSDGHNGGALAFGNDGMLYVTSGDGTADSDSHVVGQDLSRLTAKVLRIDVDHPDPHRQYSVPKDNPFVATPGARPETWAYGLRNPWRIAVDRKTGHIWVGNNGQDLWEQAYLVRRGDNYGWSVLEGSHPFYPDRQRGPTPFIMPTIDHPHSVSRSLTGGVVYHGARFPELQGAYIYGDYSTGKIWGMKHDGQQALWHRELADTSLQITGFGIDGSGELLIVDYRGQEQGGFYSLEPIPAEVSPSEFPVRLSETGLFESLRPLVPKPGLIPYSVNAPLWSDGAIKERYIAIPTKSLSENRAREGDSPDGSRTGSNPDAAWPIDMSGSHGWNFPDETVLIKSFSLALEAGNAASRRWIETRLLTRQQGEWVGYSYRWNAEQTDAVLVDAAGADAGFSIREATDAGVANERQQTWHYPSRAECMVCHSRAAHYVLGLSELQMNKDHDYGGIVDNQLRTLDHLGLLKLTKSFGEYGKLVDPYDSGSELNARARSYLHANCAQCHVAAGGGNAKFELEFTLPREKMYLFDVAPVHHTYNLPDSRLIAPGAPERSVLLERVTRRGAGQMPPLASSVVDWQAVELLAEWIRQMKP